MLLHELTSSQARSKAFTRAFDVDALWHVFMEPVFRHTHSNCGVPLDIDLEALRELPLP